MKKFPAFRKRFSDLLPSINGLRGKVRRLFLGSAVTGMGALAFGSTPPAQAVTSGAPGHSVEIAILNREKRSSAGKLILRLNNTFDKVMRAAHRSHSSHSSHASHASHASHYSSSPGSVPSSPSPTYTPPPLPQRVVSPDTSPENVAPSGEHLEKVVIEITKFDLEKSTISGKTKTGQELSFRFLPKTKIRRLTPVDLTQTMGDFRMAHPHSFPLDLNQEVMVEWKLDPRTAERVAIGVTVL